MGRDYPLPREFSRGTHWADSRHPGAGEINNHVEDGRHSYPISIHDALRHQCKIPARRYFLVVELEDGRLASYSSQQKLQKEDIVPLFGEHTARSDPRRRFSGQYPDYGQPNYARRGHLTVRPSQRFRQTYDYPEELDPDEFDDAYSGGSLKVRKRPRMPSVFQEEQSGRSIEESSSRFIDDDPPPAPAAPPRTGIRVDDKEKIWAFCDLRFRNLQQTACKTIAKAWVKLVEPKKQSNHPYTGADEGAPDWWPKPWGPTKDDKVRHKEPDHLYKKERVHLLNHILNMIIQPHHKKHQDIQKLNLRVSKLEEVTMDALATFLISRENANKRMFLKEIFQVAKAQERFLNGEIDGNHKVYVTADDKFPDDWQSGDERPGAPGDSQQMPTDQASTSSSHPSPPKPTINQHQGFGNHELHGSESSPTVQPSSGGSNSAHYVSEPSSAVQHGSSGSSTAHFVSQPSQAVQHSSSSTAHYVSESSPTVQHGSGGSNTAHYVDDLPVRSHMLHSTSEVQTFPETYTGPLPKPTPFTSAEYPSTAGIYSNNWQLPSPNLPGPSSTAPGASGNLYYTSLQQILPPMQAQAPFVAQTPLQLSTNQGSTAGYQIYGGDVMCKEEPVSAGGHVGVPSPEGQNTSPHGHHHHHHHHMDLYRQPIHVSQGGIPGSTAGYSGYMPNDGRPLSNEAHGGQFSRGCCEDRSRSSLAHHH